MVTTRGRIVTKTKGIFHPPRQKFKKSQRAPIRRRNYSNRTLSRLGHIALKTLTPGFVNPKHFELLRRFLTRRITATTLSWIRRQKRIALWARGVPTRPITQKGRGVRMGKGKGLVKYWVAPMFSGTLLTEVGANHYSPTIDSLFLAHVAKKIPLKTCVTRMKQPTIRLLYSPRFSVVSAVHTVPTAIWRAFNRLPATTASVRHKRRTLSLCCPLLFL